MQALALRLHPNQDLRLALEAVLAEHQVGAAFVLQGIGSLSAARIRLAGLPEATGLAGDLEILSLAGSLSPEGAHLHIAVSDAQGRVLGGHVAQGCIVRTTAEILVTLLPDLQFNRKADVVTGFMELEVNPRFRSGDG